MSLFIGLMSGTSMDGIDAALVDISNNTLIAGITRAYGEKAQQALRDVVSGEPIMPARLRQIDTLIGREFAYAAQQLMATTHVPTDQIIAIGSHGQTICHDVMADIPYTLQLGCAHTIAELTGKMVVADFRTRDVVLGGQGAPFAPIYHQALFGSLTYPIAVVNIGGIANVTYLAHGEVRGHDVGPGNCLMDVWVHQHLNQPYDQGGQWAATGRVIQPLLSRFLADPYFKLASPKSIGKEYFSLEWLLSHTQPDYASHDIQATLLALTVTSICQAIEGFDLRPEQLAICGGGVHNHALLKALSAQLPDQVVASTSAIGVDPDFLEAMMFAWLAAQTVNQIPIDLTRITGAKHPAILGAIYARGL